MKSKSQKTSGRPSPEAAEALLKAEIQKEAHRIWVAEGRRHGEDLRHWLEAERVVLARQPKF